MARNATPSPPVTIARPQTLNTLFTRAESAFRLLTSTEIANNASLLIANDDTQP
jgi:hypothetical protein